MILGLTGLAGCGKDTAANHLVAHRGYERRAFADPMRTALYALDPLVRVHGSQHRLSALVDTLGWDQAKRGVPEVRRLLQRFGTEVGRTMWGDDFWITQALHGVAPGDRIVVTDVRFPNEGDAVRALGGRVVRIDRPGAGLGGAEGGHATETQFVDADAVVVNDGDLADLAGRLDALLASFGVRDGENHERVA